MRIKFVTLVALFSALLAGCGGGSSTDTAAAAVCRPTMANPDLCLSGGALVASSNVALFTTAPEALTLGVGAALEFTIAGGRSPYTAVSNNTTIAISAVKDSKLTVGGVANGAAVVRVQDAVGASVNIGITVSSGQTQALFTTAPLNATIAPGVGGAQSYRVGGGVAPYTVASSNTSVATVTLVSDLYTITGISAGSTTLVVTDSLGAAINVNVTIPTVSSLPLFTTAPTAVTVGIGASAGYSVGGGTAPYTATSSNTSKATVVLVGSSLTVTGVVTGTANVVVRDNTGTTVTVAVTVPATTTVDFFTSAPSAVTVAIGASTSYNVGGGTAPYFAESSNSSIASVSLAGNTVTVTGQKKGATPVVVSDSVGKTLTINVTVGAQVLAVTPNDATAIINDVLVATITGGTAPFRASVGNTLVASAVVQNTNELVITLLQVGGTVVTVLDANSESVAYTLESNAATPGIRLSPNAVKVSEFDSAPIVFTVFGAAPGAVNVFSSDITRLGATIAGETITVTNGTNGNRCIPGLGLGSTLEVTITVVDATRATGTAIVSITENGGTCL